MKKWIAAALAAVLMLAFSACTSSILEQSDTENTAAQDAQTYAASASDTQPAGAGESGRILVAYFSYSGNTRSVAQAIQQQTGADLFEINTTYAYPSEYNDVVEQAQQEQRENARPELNDTVENMEQYDVVFLGYPNWWGDMPMVVYSFLETYDLSGKTVAPFVTSGGSGFSNTIASIEELQPQADVQEGLALRDTEVGSADANEQITQWLSGLNVL